MVISIIHNTKSRSKIHNKELYLVSFFRRSRLAANETEVLHRLHLRHVDIILVLRIEFRLVVLSLHMLYKSIDQSKAFLALEALEAMHKLLGLFLPAITASLRI